MSCVWGFGEFVRLWVNLCVRAGYGQATTGYEPFTTKVMSPNGDQELVRLPADGTSCQLINPVCKFII